MTILAALVSPARAGSIDLFDLAFSVQGGVSGDWQDVIATDPTTVFDSTSTIVCCGDASGGTTPGIGTVNYTFNPGAAGTYTVTLYFDYDVSTPFFNEYGIINNGSSAQPGISYEIFNADSLSSNIILFGAKGTPGGETYGLADNKNHVPGTTSNFLTNCTATGCNADVGMALTYSFTLTAGQEAVLAASASTTNPGGFSLQTTHPADPNNLTASSLYLDGSYTLGAVGITASPEPSTWVLFGTSLALLGLVRARGGRGVR